MLVDTSQHEYVWLNSVGIPIYTQKNPEYAKGDFAYIQAEKCHTGRFHGNINGDIIEMTERTVSDILQKGGTCLYTARCPEFRTSEGVDKAVEKCKEIGLEGIVVIGGDGSFRGARDLSLRGIPCVGGPGTILQREFFVLVFLVQLITISHAQNILSVTIQL